MALILAAAPPPGHRPPPKILLVDAHADTRDLYEIWLQLHDFAVSGCGSAAEALTRVGADAPDVIVAELMVPGGGPHLVADLRATAEGADALLIVLTTQSTAALRAQALEAGADVYLVKPCGAEQLGEVVAAVSHRRLTGPRAAQRDLAIRERLEWETGPPTAH